MNRQTAFVYDDELWIHSKDANPTALSIFHEHYSYRPYADGRKPLCFVGPGEKMVLLTPNADALFVWRKFISGDNQEGVNCAVFRNTSSHRSPDLIREAARIALGTLAGREALYLRQPEEVER